MNGRDNQCEALQALLLSSNDFEGEITAERKTDKVKRAGVFAQELFGQLRGGDAWDASIRKKIKEYAPFVPVISANTESRTVGCFRRAFRAVSS